MSTSVPAPAAIAPGETVFSLRRLSKDYALYLSSVLVRAGMTFLFTLFLANWLSPAEYGRASNGQAMCEFLILFALLGFNQGYVILQRSETTQEGKESVQATANYAIWFLYVLLALCIAVGWKFLSGFFFDVAPASLFLLPCLILLGAHLVREVNGVAARFSFRPRLFVATEIASGLVYVLLGVLLVFIGLGATAPLWAAGVGILAVSPLVYHRLGNPFRGRPNWSLLNRLARVSLPLGLNSLAALLPLVASRVILTEHGGMVVVAVYSLALSLSRPVSLLLASFQTAWTPHMLEHFDREHFQKRATTVAVFLLITAAFGALTTQLSAELFLPLLIRRAELLPAAEACGLLIFFTALRTLETVTSRGYVLRERSHHAIWLAAVSIPFSIATAYLLVAYFDFGIFGVICGEGVGVLTRLLLGSAVSYYYLPIRFPFGRMSIFLAVSIILFAYVALDNIALGDWLRILTSHGLALIVLGVTALILFRGDLKGVLRSVSQLISDGRIEGHRG